MKRAPLSKSEFTGGRRGSVRLVSLAFVFVALAALLALWSFSNGAAPTIDDHSRNVRLVLALNTDSSTRDVFRAAIAEFTVAHPEISVRLLEIPGDYYQKLLVMIAGKTAPDLMWMGEPFVEFADRGVFLDVTKNVQQEIDRSRFVPEALGWYRLGNRQYGVAFGFDLRFIVYNKELFDAGGVPYPRNGWTYADFLEKAKKLTLTDRNGRVVQYGFSGSLDPALFGASVLDSDNNYAKCDSPEMLDFLQTNLDLAEKYHVAPHGKELLNEALEDPVSVFRQGRTAMMVMATWNLAYLQDRCADMDWDVSTNPIVRREGHWASSEAILISSETKHPREAWLLYKTFLDVKFQREMAGIIIPSNVDAAAAWVATNHHKPTRLDALVEATRTMYRLPQIENLREIMAVYFDSCASVWSCRSTPATAMARAASQINDILSERRREEQ
jgi:multiple sugar transport system substrate-binding protein